MATLQSRHPGYSVKLGPTFRLLTAPSYQTDMPAGKVLGKNYVTKSHPDCMVDGHWVKWAQQDQFSLRGLVPVTQADLEGGTPLDLGACFQIHWRKGDPDVTASERIPTLPVNFVYEFETTDYLEADVEDFEINTALTLKWDASRGRAVLGAAATGNTIVARVVGAIDKGDWMRCVRDRGIAP